MAYEKYIEKDGKIYGPYIYHSRRVNGKVVSEYLGTKGFRHKNILIIASVIVFVLLLFFVSLKFYNGFTGKAVLSIDANYIQGEPIEGVIKLSLTEGELIPSKSKIIFENEGSQYEYLLEEIISDESTQGDFYVEGVSISGTGGGYGIKGVKEIYPEVSFVLGISNQVLSEEPVSSGESIIEEPASEIEEPVSNATEETTSDSEISMEEQTVDAINQETTLEIVTEVEEPTPEVINEEPTPEEISEEQIPESGSGGVAPITGNFVKGIFSKVSNLFLILTPTGNVALEFGKEISGQTSKNIEFIYHLSEGEAAELISGSVNVDGKNLPDNYVSVDSVGDRVIVMTEYSEEAEGFGEEYLGNDKKELIINMSDLNLDLKEGDLTIRLVYENEEILSVKGLIEENTKIKETGVIEDIGIISNKTLEDEILNKSELNNLTDFGLNVLTDEEFAILKNAFGNQFSVKTEKAELFKDRLVIKYVLGEYWIEYSYDYPGEIDDKLKEKLEDDKIKWLKDIAGTLLGVESEGIEISELIDEETYGEVNQTEINGTQVGMQ